MLRNCSRDEHFKQSVHELAASYTCYQCKMKPGQTYGDWVADLRCISEDRPPSRHTSDQVSFYTDNMCRMQLVHALTV